MSLRRNATVLVTGHTGFAGRWLAAELVRRGARVVGMARRAIVDRMAFPAGTAEEIVAVQGAVEDYDLVEQTLRTYRPETVFHLAGQAIVGLARENPMATFATNIQGTWVLLEACRRTVPEAHVVVASSDQAYGMQSRLPCTEDHPLQGRHPYDVSKSCADLIAIAYASTYDMPVSVARCSNLYGPGDLNFSRLIPGTIRSALRGERPVIRSDGSPLRDFLYVKDMVEGFLRLAQRMEDRAIRGRAFNFGSGARHSVLELTRRILRAAAREDLQPVVLNETRGEIQHKLLSIAAAERDLGWKPAATIEERLAETVAWYRECLDPVATATAGAR